MTRRVRTVLLVLGLPLLLLLIAGFALLGPRLGAARTLITFGWPVPEDLESLEKPPLGYEHLADPAVLGVADVLVRSVQDGKAHPTIVFLHGVTRKGLRDGRILRAIEGFHRGGFTVIAPELKPLMDPTRSPDELDGLDKLLDAVSAGKVAGADGSKLGIVGVSVGGAVALRIAAAFRERNGQGLRGVLAIGAPDDLRTTARAWFAASDPDPEGGADLQWKRRNAAAFARNFVVRAALPERVGTQDDFVPLRDWLASEPLPKADPPTLSSDEARALVDFLFATPAHRDEQREALLADAWPRLRVLSPADWSGVLPALRGVAVFLLHGEADPLIPVGEMARLEERLKAFTLVSTLRSRLLGHASLGDATLGERLDHVVFLDDFFDMLGG